MKMLDDGRMARPSALRLVAIAAIPAGLAMLLWFTVSPATAASGSTLPSPAAKSALQGSPTVAPGRHASARQGKRRMGANPGAYYTVWLRNGTSDTLTVTMPYAFLSNGQGVVQSTTQVLNPGDARPFLLGGCDNLLAYYVVLPQYQFQWPTDGPMTPARSSQFNPTDTEPCVDSWSIG
jgi:hypothetical protein